MRIKVYDVVRIIGGKKNYRITAIDGKYCFLGGMGWALKNNVEFVWGWRSTGKWCKNFTGCDSPCKIHGTKRGCPVNANECRLMNRVVALKPRPLARDINGEGKHE